MLLGGGADLNHESCRGTALIAAATDGDVESVAVLLEAGAEVDYRTVGGVVTSTFLPACMHVGHNVPRTLYSLPYNDNRPHHLWAADADGFCLFPQ